MISPVSTSQMQIVMSYEPETTRLPSGENATDVTSAVCPSNGPEMISPVSTSQMQIVMSSEPETTCLPSGENATDVTHSVCSTKTVKMAGHVVVLPVWMTSVFRYCGKNCLDIL